MILELYSNDGIDSEQQCWRGQPFWSSIGSILSPMWCVTSIERWYSKWTGSRRRRQAHGRKNNWTSRGLSTYSLVCQSCNTFIQRSSNHTPTLYPNNANAKELLTSLKATRTTSVCVDLEARKDAYSKGTNRPWKIIQSNQNTYGLDLPTEMDGSLEIQDILIEYDKKIQAEIDWTRLKHLKNKLVQYLLCGQCCALFSCSSTTKSDFLICLIPCSVPLQLFRDIMSVRGVSGSLKLETCRIYHM